MNLSRRSFLGGATAFGALGGCRLFTADDIALESPRLRFGVVTDIHFVYDVGGFPKPHNGDTFETALRWFDARGVDAVLCCGDMADRGLVAEWREVARIWNLVFPGNIAADGRRVEPVFTTGNHDWEGQNYGKNVERIHPDPLERGKNILANDYARWWKEIFHEDYAPVFRKEVKGYSFVGAHWCGGRRCSGKDENPNTFIGEFYAKNAKKFDPRLPFFHIQHAHPKDTCYGPWAWGHDDGSSTRALSMFPNAVAFSGHSHYSLTDERSVWQGAFTSIGAASLRYGCPTEDEPGKKGGWGESDAVRTDWNNRQGMLVSVYDDRLVISRREFTTGLSLGPDWVVPLPASGESPFALERRQRDFAAPEFIGGAVLAVEKTEKAFKLTVPPSADRDDARLFQLKVTAEAGDKKLVKWFSPRGYNASLASGKTKTPTICTFPRKELPAGGVKFRVEPVGSFNHTGKPLDISVS